MKDCEHVPSPPLFTDMGDHWHVKVICIYCMEIIREWDEPYTEDFRKLKEGE